MKRHFLFDLVVAATIGAAGCADSTTLVPEHVNAAPAPVREGAAVVARYWAEVHPKLGNMELFPLHEGNIIYREEGFTTAVNYNYAVSPAQDMCAPGDTCLPASGFVSLLAET